MTEEQREKRRQDTRRYRATAKGKANSKKSLDRYRSSPEGLAKTRKASRRCMANRRTQDPIGYWAYNLSKRAKDRGLEYDLTPEWIAEKLAPMKCEMTGIALQHTGECKEFDQGRMEPWAPSFDRLDSTRGYTQDNVHLICWALNLAKGAWSFDVYETVAKAYMEKQIASPNC